MKNSIFLVATALFLLLIVGIASPQPQTKVANAQPVTDAKSYITIDSSWSSLKTKGKVIGGWTRAHWSGGTPLTSPNNFALLCADRDDCFKLPKGGTFEARLVDNPNSEIHRRSDA